MKSIDIDRLLFGISDDYLTLAKQKGQTAPARDLTVRLIDYAEHEINPELRIRMFKQIGKGLVDYADGKLKELEEEKRRRHTL